MIATRHNNLALRQSEIQLLQYKIKEINLSLIRLVAERRELARKREELGAMLEQPHLTIVRCPPPPPPPPKIKVIKKRKEKLRGTGGRKTIFTTEVLAQIPVWIEEGLGRDEIAARIGCSRGSLQVTCSRKGVSLWRKGRNRVQQVVYQQEEEVV